MSETIQFMVGAGQTVTSGVLPSYRSDAQESQLIGNNHHLQDPEVKTSQRSYHPLANYAHVQQLRVKKKVENYKVQPHLESHSQECQIQIYQDPRALDTETSNQTSAKGGCDSQGGIDASIEKLSKASKYYEKQSSFELTSKWNPKEIRGFNNMVGVKNLENGSNHLENKNIGGNTNQSQVTLDQGPTMFDLQS